MRSRLRKLIRKPKSGETLIETIVSLAIFSIVMLVVTTMVTISYNVLEASERQYSDINATINNIEHGNTGASADTPGMTYTLEVDGETVDAPGGNTDTVDLYEVGPDAADPAKTGGIQLFARHRD